MVLQKYTERVVSIDIIRGFALLGIFFVNVSMIQHKKIRVKEKTENNINFNYS